MSPATYLMNQGPVIVEYLKRAVWPVGLVFDYGVASRGKITTAGNSRIRGATDPAKSVSARYAARPARRKSRSGHAIHHPEVQRCQLEFHHHVERENRREHFG